MYSKADLQKKAEEDIASIAAFIAQDDPDAAERFFDAVEEMSALISEMPQIGSVRIFEHASLKEVRIMPIKQFEKYLMFYRELGDTIEIVRVVHGARDLPALFEE